MPRLSIGMPVFNGERFLAEAVTSLLDQTFADFELIICDNASSDATPTICRALQERDGRIRYHRNEANLGAAKNFNRCFNLAKGAYFKWAAYDDVCSPTFLQRCIEVLDNDPGIILCHARTGWIDENGKRIGKDTYELRLDAASPRTRFEDLIVIRHDCFLVFGVIRQEVLARTRLIGNYIGSDRVLLGELGLWGRFHQVPDILFHRRHHNCTSMNLDERKERVAWFDPARAGRISFPNWRILGEHLVSVQRSTLAPSVKLSCLLPIGKHIGVRHSFLRKDLREAFKVQLRRSRFGNWVFERIRGVLRPGTR